MYSQENISIFNKLRIFDKNSVIFKSVCFNNDRVITQHAPTCVENCSDH